MAQSLPMQPTAPMFPTGMGHIHGPAGFQDPAIAAATPAFAVTMHHGPVDHSNRQQQQHHHVVVPGQAMDMGGPHGPHVSFAGLPGSMGGMTDSHPFMMPAGDQSNADNQNGPPENTHSSTPKRMVIDPPNLQEWRQRLFDCDELTILTNDQ